MAHLSSLLTIALVIGVAAGVSVDAPVVLAAALAMSCAWAMAVLAYLRGHPRLLLAGQTLLIVGAGWILGAHALERALHTPLRHVLEQRFGGFALEGQVAEGRLDEPIVIEGRLREDALLSAGGAVIRVAVTRVWINQAGERVAGGVSLGISGELQPAHVAEWRAGRVIRAPALLRRPARYLNEGVPDQERVLARRGVSLVGTIKSAALVELVRPGHWWEELAGRARARTRRALAQHVRPLGEQPAAIATAILIGDRAGLAEETERRLQEAGTYHVIAISGGNIAVLTGLLLAAMGAAGLRGRFAWAITIAALAAYGVIASGGASVLRATLMAVIYLAVRLIDQRTAAANAISLTAAVTLLANPLQILDVGFWFTFGATIALLVGARVTASARSRLVLSVLLGTALVEIALAPIMVLVFQRVTFAGLLLNLVALPAMTLVQLSAMAVVVLDVVEWVAAARALSYGVCLGGTALTESAQLLDFAPWLTWRVPSPPGSLIAAYYVALCALIGAHARGAPVRFRRAVAVVVSTLFLWIIAAPVTRVRSRGDGQLHLSMLDVGQGDAIVATFPNGRHLLVDAGGVPRGAFDIGDRVVGPALRARRLLRFDYLAVTHGDADHLGGARSLVRDFMPHEVWWGIPVANHDAEAALRDEAARQRAAWRTWQRGDVVEISGVEVRLHHPPPADWERQRVRNNDSLVFELRFGTVSVVLAGDIEGSVEEQLSPTLDPLRTVVLKVAHHGSATSSSRAFLDRLRPSIALIGVGRGNPYGHPAPFVLGRLHDVGAEVFRTDLDGQIDLVTDGRTVDVRTFTGRRFHGPHRRSHEGHEGHEGHGGR